MADHYFLGVVRIYWRRQIHVDAATITGFDPTFESPAESSGSFNYNPTSAYTSTSGIINPPSAFGAAAAPQGSQVGFLQTNTGDSHYNGVTNGMIAGSITGLAVGQPYDITGFEAYRSGQPSAAFSVSVGGTQVGAEQASSSSAYNAFTTGAFIATSTSESLALLSTGPTDSTTFIDNLSVTQLPEPGTVCSLCSALLAACGLLLFRRRQFAGAKAI